MEKKPDIPNKVEEVEIPVNRRATVGYETPVRTNDGGDNTPASNTIKPKIVVTEQPRNDGGSNEPKPTPVIIPPKPTPETPKNDKGETRQTANVVPDNIVETKPKPEPVKQEAPKPIDSGVTKQTASVVPDNVVQTQPKPEPVKQEEPKPVDSGVTKQTATPVDLKETTPVATTPTTPTLVGDGNTGQTANSYDPNGAKSGGISNADVDPEKPTASSIEKQTIGEFLNGIPMVGQTASEFDPNKTLNSLTTAELESLVKSSEKVVEGNAGFFEALIDTFTGENEKFFFDRRVYNENANNGISEAEYTALKDLIAERKEEERRNNSGNDNSYSNNSSPSNDVGGSPSSSSGGTSSSSTGGGSADNDHGSTSQTASGYNGP